MEKGAHFSDCRSRRYFLWRIWDRSKPFVMFIGLNPSKADESENDNTIKRVISIAENLGYGGIYMMNCFPYISTDPNDLINPETRYMIVNSQWLEINARLCKDVVFAWGNFKIVRSSGEDKMLIKKFPNAKALHINKNGSPKHPLYCKINSQLIPFQP